MKPVFAAVLGALFCIAQAYAVCYHLDTVYAMQTEIDSRQCEIDQLNKIIGNLQRQEAAELGRH